MKRADWARGKIASTDSARLAFWWFFALLWNAGAWPAFWWLALPEIRAGHQAALIVLLFPLVGVGLLVAALHVTWRRLKYGPCHLILPRSPVPIGGVLDGRIVIPRGFHPETDPIVSLRCVQRVTTSYGNNRRTHTHGLWHRDAEIDKSAVTPARGGSEIPVRIPIDADCLPTNPAARISWELSVSARTSGIDFETTFVVPVFFIPGEAAHTETLRPAEASRHTPQERLNVAGIRWDESSWSGHPALVIAPVFPGAGALIALGMSGTLLYGAYLLHKYHLSATGAVVVVALIGLVVLVGILGLFRGPTRVVFGPESITVTSRGLFGRKTRQVDPRRIRAVQAGLGGAQHGKAGTYQLMFACDASHRGGGFADTLLTGLMQTAARKAGSALVLPLALPIPIGGVFRSQTAAQEAAAFLEAKLRQHYRLAGHEK